MSKSPSVKNIYHDLTSLWVHLNPKRRFQASLILILMVIASIAEIVSIGAVLPFLGVLTSPEVIFEHPYAEKMINFFEII